MILDISTSGVGDMPTTEVEKQDSTSGQWSFPSLNVSWVDVEAAYLKSAMFFINTIQEAHQSGKSLIYMKNPIPTLSTKTSQRSEPVNASILLLVSRR